jgi:hypothetical protein
MTSRRSLLLGLLGFAKEPASYRIPLIRTKFEASPPAGDRIAFGWNAFRVDRPLHFAWKALVRQDETSRFRLTLALEQGGPAQVEIFLAQGNRVVGAKSIAEGAPFDMFEFPLTGADTELALRQGLGLRPVSGADPLMLFGPESAGQTMPEEIQPHLMVAGTESPRTEWAQRLLSGAAINVWNWKLGCFLDGLLDMEPALGKRKTRATLERVSKLTLAERGDDATPYAALARFDPKHPALDDGIKLCRQQAQQQTTPARGYTLAYPLAALSDAKKDAALADLAAAQLQAPLPDNLPPGQFALHFLGFARSMTILRQTRKLEAEFRRLGEIASRMTADPSAWPATALAAGLAIGSQTKLLPPEAEQSARQTAAASEKLLTPDGFLKGSDRIAPCAIGFYAQVVRALGLS